jgi:hypothetical protein
MRVHGVGLGHESVQKPIDLRRGQTHRRPVLRPHQHRFVLNHRGHADQRRHHACLNGLKQNPGGADRAA